MKAYRKNSVVVGILLILFAVMLLLNKMGILAVFPSLKFIMKIALIVILIYFIVESIGKKSFLGVTIPLGIIACLFSDLLGIAMVSPFIIILVSILIGVGLSMIFDNKPKVNVITSHDNSEVNHFKGSGSEKYSEVNGKFEVENSFGERTAYISVKDLKRGSIDNGFGLLTVYLNGTTIDPSGAKISLDNGLGKLQVYIPKEFRVSVNVDNGLGTVNTHGNASTDESLPLLKLDIDNGLGVTDIYFE